jgi:hypothetical protein
MIMRQRQPTKRERVRQAGAAKRVKLWNDSKNLKFLEPGARRIIKPRQG